jgi:hypothetical protein
MYSKYSLLGLSIGDAGATKLLAPAYTREILKSERAVQIIMINTNLIRERQGKYSSNYAACY